MCESKAAELGHDSEDGQMWRLIKSSAGSVKEIVKSLGFDKEDIVSRTEKYTGKTHKLEVETNNKREDNSSPLNHLGSGFAQMDDNQLEGFFNTLSNTVQNENE